jgi:uncharacterized membrane protein (UPF0127 family)
MRNVAGPLRLAWLAPDGQVRRVVELEPGSEGHRPAERVASVLEFPPDHPLADVVRAGRRVAGC